jgi:hypothetical protein
VSIRSGLVDPDDGIVDGGGASATRFPKVGAGGTTNLQIGYGAIR